MRTVLVEKKDIDEIVEVIQNHQVVSFPTETVFGLGVRFDSKSALQAIYELKHRADNKAITLMVAKKRDIAKYAIINELAQKVINAFMPGKITIILERKETIDATFTAYKSTIGIRIPDDPFTLELLNKVGPMWVTSANVSGQASMATDQDVYQQFKGKVPMIVKGNTNSVVASSVVDVSTGNIKILREGEITKMMIEEAIQ